MYRYFHFGQRTGYLNRVKGDTFWGHLEYEAKTIEPEDNPGVLSGGAESKSAMRETYGQTEWQYPL